MKIALTALMLAGAAGAANAAIIFESESNNTIATANPLGTYSAPGDGILVDGSITPGAQGVAGDVDWFSFTVTGPTTLVASIFALSGANQDSMLILVDSGGNILASDDDDNVGLMSSLDPIVLAAGTYYIGVTGWNDLGSPVSIPDGFNGTTGIGHSAEFVYKLVIGLNIVPTPGTAALLGLGVLAAGRRRR